MFVSLFSFVVMLVVLCLIIYNLGVNKDYGLFVVLLGVSIKMDGCGVIYLVLCVVFIV